MKKNNKLLPGTMCMDPPSFINEQGEWERIYEPGKWVSVKEAMPKLGEKVLICSSEYPESGIDIGKLDKDKKSKEYWWLYHGGIYQQEDVTHWSPIPPIPQKEENHGELR